MDIFEKYKPELDLVEAELSRNLTSDQGDLNEICDYIRGLKGKRFRPLIVILSYKICGGSKTEEIIPLATGMEFIHTATLVHDDINDTSPLRRGYETVYSKFGMSKALIIGDYLFSIGFRLGGSYGKDVVELVAKLSARLAEGEFIHLKNSRNPELSEDTYLDIIERKTSGPIIGGAKVGAIITECGQDVIDDLGSYGRNIGMAFQIIDDILDITGSESEIGKPTNADLKSGKITLPTIYALSELEGENRNKLIETIKTENASESSIEEALEIIKSTNAINKARSKAKAYIDDAVSALKIFEAHEIYPSLVELANYTVERKY